MTQIIVQVYPPEVTPEKYAIDTGLNLKGRKRSDENGTPTDSQVVDGMIKNGHLPTLKRGKYRMINLVELAAENAASMADGEVEIIVRKQ